MLPSSTSSYCSTELCWLSRSRLFLKKPCWNSSSLTLTLFHFYSVSLSLKRWLFGSLSVRFLSWLLRWSESERRRTLLNVLSLLSNSYWVCLYISLGREIDMYFVGASSNASCSGKLQAVAAISKRSTCHVVVPCASNSNQTNDWLATFFR